MDKTVIVGTDLLRKAAKNLFYKGEISREDYLKIEERNRQLPEDKRNTTICLH